MSISFQLNAATDLHPLVAAACNDWLQYAVQHIDAVKSGLLPPDAWLAELDAMPTDDLLLFATERAIAALEFHEHARLARSFVDDASIIGGWLVVAHAARGHWHERTGQPFTRDRWLLVNDPAEVCG